MSMLDCKIMTSPCLSPTPSMNALSSECYGIWEHETLNPITTKLEVTDIMEFIDPSNTTILPSTSSCSSSPASSPSSVTTIITTSPIDHNLNSNNNNNNSNHNHHHHQHNRQLSHISTISEDSYTHEHETVHHRHNSNTSNNINLNNSYTSSSHYLTPLPSLIMAGDQNPYSPSEVQMLDSFNTIGNPDHDFHKLTDSFTESYENFMSDETHHQIQSLSSSSHHHNHHNHQEHHQSSNNELDQSHHLHNHQQQHQQQQHSNPNHHQHHQNNANNQLLDNSCNSFQFNEPLLVAHHHNHHPHYALQHSSSYHSNSEYNLWDDPNSYPGEYRFACKGESPTTSDSVSYTSIDSGIECSKSSSAESISTATFIDNHHNVSPPKRRVGRPPKKDKKLKKLEKKTGRLWEFIRDLLKNPEYCPSLVRWENPEEGHFRFVNSDQVAKLWGRLKGNPRMTYEKLSRAMRYYYKSHVFEPVLGRRLVYKFGYNATNWRPINPNFSQKIFC